jgi:hypothetical protein
VEEVLQRTSLSFLFSVKKTKMKKSNYNHCENETSKEDFATSVEHHRL